VTPPQGPPPRPQRPQAASPAERSKVFADHQRRLKEEAAERREKADASPPPAQSDRPRRTRG